MTVPYLLRFCPYRASILWQSVTQGVASLALGYALVGLSARPRLNQKLQLLMFVRANLRFFWDKGWGAEIKAKTEGENVVLFCPQIIVSFWWLRAFGMISEWFRNDIGMSKPKKWVCFLYRKFRHSEMENKMGAMFKIFMSNAKVFCFLMKGHFLRNERSLKKWPFLIALSIENEGIHIFFGKGHSVIWSFLKKTLGKGAPFGVA